MPKSDSSHVFPDYCHLFPDRTVGRTQPDPVGGLRHTFATELAKANVSVYTLVKLMGHESMVTSQRCVQLRAVM